MAYTRRSYSDIAVVTTLAVDINSITETITIVASTGWPTGGSGNFFIQIEDEIIDIDSRSSVTLTAQSGGRGANGTSAAAHLAGVAVTVVYTANDADEANYAVSKTVGIASAVGQIPVADGTNSFAAVQAKTSGQILVGSGTTLASVPVSGDATLASTGALTIANDAVTYAKLQNVSATARLLGRVTAAAGNAEEIPLNATLEFSGGSVQRAALTGDVTATAGSNATAIGANKITNTMMADDSVGSAEIIAAAVGTSEIADAAVTAAKLVPAIPLGGTTAASVTANQTGITTGPTDLTSLAVTITGDGVRRYEITLKITVTASGGAGQGFISIREGSTQIVRYNTPFSSGTDIQTVAASFQLVPSAASHTYKLSAGKNAFSMDLTASATDPSYIYARDIGV